MEGVRRFILLLIPLLAACGKHDAGTTVDAFVIDAFAGPFPDFPVDPIVDTGVTPDVPGLFGDPTSGAAMGGPCLVEPEVGTLFPNNWLRPRFSWIASGTENMFELQLTAANQINPLIVYTSATSWTMPAAIWSALAAHTEDQPITVTIRGATYSAGAFTSGPAQGTAGAIAIAPVAAPGAIVYWTTSAGTALRGFHIGDETVTDVMHPSDAATACIGCHASTPDGMFIGFSASATSSTGDPSTLDLLSSDGQHTAPTFVTASAQTLMARTQQWQPQFSTQHWQSGDHVAITLSQTGIMWTDLEASSTAQGVGWDMLVRTGDANTAAMASFAHDSDTVLYVSAPSEISGVEVYQGDLATVPFNNRAGGTATTIPGANTSTYNEFYPTFSPDDRYVAFNRVPNGASSYNDAASEVFAIPAAGGTPVRLLANDPPVCSGHTSPGVTNSWPKWSPEATDSAGKRYYWLTFSSTRGAGNPQLYVTPLVDDGSTLTTFPALYLWNQPATDSNHTPVWDNFNIIQ